MELKGHFVKNGEEAYALDAFTSRKLEDMGYREVLRNRATNERHYRKDGEDDVRLVRIAGSARSGIVDFGAIARETLTQAGWQETGRVGLEDFVNKADPFAQEAPVQAPVPVIGFAGNYGLTII